MKEAGHLGQDPGFLFDSMGEGKSFSLDESQSSGFYGDFLGMAHPMSEVVPQFIKDQFPAPLNAFVFMKNGMGTREPGLTTYIKTRRRIRGGNILADRNHLLINILHAFSCF
jgi:hypothetical protein